MKVGFYPFENGSWCSEFIYRTPVFIKDDILYVVVRTLHQI